MSGTKNMTAMHSSHVRSDHVPHTLFARELSEWKSDWNYSLSQHKNLSPHSRLTFPFDRWHPELHCVVKMGGLNVASDRPRSLTWCHFVTSFLLSCMVHSA